MARSRARVRSARIRKSLAIAGRAARTTPRISNARCRRAGPKRFSLQGDEHEDDSDRGDGGFGVIDGWTGDGGPKRLGAERFPRRLEPQRPASVRARAGAARSEYADGDRVLHAGVQRRPAEARSREV